MNPSSGDAPGSYAPSTLVEPSLFWFWNANPTRDSICRQLDEFQAKSIRALFIHPMPDAFRPEDFHGGMQVPYLSNEFFEWVAFACEEMKARGMRLWLYDEGGWPSGAADGKVIADNPDFGLWALQRNGQEYAPVQPKLEIGCPDLMNPGATRAFIRHVHERYREYCGDEFGRTIPGIFTDEARLGNRVGTDTIPWSPLLPEAFEAQHGFSLQKILPLLFETNGSSADVVVAQQQYLATVSTLIAENYYGEIRRWCDADNLLFTGHHSGEDEWAHHGKTFGDYMQQARRYHIPGVDAIWRQVFSNAHGGNYVGLASSRAWLSGTSVAMSEVFAVYGAGLTLQQMHWVAAHHLVRGVNFFVFMYALLEADGARRIGTCSPDFTPRSPQWEHLDLLIETIRRAAQFSVEGAARPRTGVYYRSELLPLENEAEFNGAHEELCNHLHDAGAGVLFAGREELQHARVENGEIVVGEMRLALLAVHNGDALREEEAALLQRLEDEGARVYRNASLEAIPLENISQLQFESTPPRGLRVLPLQDGDAWRFLLFNANPHEVEARFGFAQPLREVALEELPPNNEYSLNYNNGLYHWKLYPGQIAALETAGTVASTAPLQLLEERELSGNWQVRETRRFVIEDAIRVEGAEKEWRVCELGDYCDINPDFSGTLSYRTNFDYQVSGQSTPILLDLGVLFYAAQVKVNGVDCGRRGWQPFMFDITSALRDGENQLEVCVTNTLANQWARPEIRERDLNEYPNPYLKRTLPFINESVHAGLCGPVKLRFYKQR
jgi:hypothetical protein